MSEFTPSRIDKFDLIICTPAVLIVFFGSHVLGALLFGLFCAMLALGRVIFKMLPKAGRPHVARISQPKATFHLVSHARMSRVQWNAMNTRDKRPEALWAEIKRIYHLEDRYVKFTADGWVTHINWNGQFQQAGSRLDADPQGEVFLYFYTLPDAPVPAEPEPVVMPVIPESDDARWARMYRENPLAYWLDPKLWCGVGYTPGDVTKMAIELSKVERFRGEVGNGPTLFGTTQVKPNYIEHQPSESVCHWACHPYDSSAYSRCDNKCGHAPSWAGTKNAEAYPK